MSRLYEIPATDLTLSDGVIHLRPWQARDADAIFEAIQESRPALQQWLPAAGSVASIDEVRSYIKMTTGARAAGGAYDFVMEDAVSGNLLGGCGLTQINRNHRFANLYYWVRSGQTGRGVASRAIRLAARFGLEGVGLTRIEIVVETDNLASLGAAQKAGAVREAILRNRLTVRNIPRDAVMFSLVPADFA